MSSSCQLPPLTNEYCSKIDIVVQTLLDGSTVCLPLCSNPHDFVGQRADKGKNQLGEVQQQLEPHPSIYNFGWLLTN